MDKKEEDLQEELDKARKEIKRLKEIISEKDLEVSFVVHDLKNPLSVIEMNFSVIKSIMEEHEELSRCHRIAGLVDSQILSMKHLIHELLNISKMENAKHTLELSEVQVSSFLEEVLAANNAAAENNDMSISLSIEDGIGSIFIDKDLMDRVFANLIINAIKYSVESHDIVLHALKSKKPDHVRFIVEDFGAGIPEENLQRVFDKFQHDKTKDSTKPIAHGLGLYFSKLTVELHGGNISVESELEKGSKFIFDLPRKPPTS